MENNQHPREQSAFEKFIAKPKFNFWWSILFAIALSVVTWWLTLAKVEPVYMTSPIEVVARKESPRLAISWDGKEIGNLCVTKIALLNTGSVPLRNDLFTESDPIRITTESRIEILDVELAHTSRPNLSASPAIQPNRREFRFSIDGGDAFEKNDGVAFRILSTGACAGLSFKAKGRVIGTTNGFKPLESFGNIPIKNTPTSKYEVLGIAILTLLSFVAFLYKGFELYSIGSFKWTYRIIACLFIVVIFVFGSLVLTTLITPTISWVSF